MELLTNPPKTDRLRITLAKSDEAKIVDRTGGEYGGGKISGVSAITRGEALGHDLWIDSVFLDQVASALNAPPAGVKSRFTHPDLSADGLAKFLGRARGGAVDGDKVSTDLHLAKTAHQSPDGDLAGYVLARTEEDPTSFGASIVFLHDRDAEVAHAIQHGAVFDGDGDLRLDQFQSPDPDNTKNLLHARLAALEAVDLVDEPAANPDGLFHRGLIADVARLADYALGLAEDVPDDATALSVHPDRLRAFAERYLRNRRLRLVSASTDPQTDPEPTEANAAASGGSATNDGPDRPLAEYCAAFGDGPGARHYLDGTKYADAQRAANAALREENEALRDKLALAEKEHDKPLDLQPRTNKKTLRDLTRIRK